MKFKSAGYRQILRWFIVAVVILMIAVYLLLPMTFGFVATRPRQTLVGAPPEGFQPVLLTTEDQVKLGAWYVPPTNGGVIILLHGAGGSRNDVRPYATMLVEQGFGVLAFDQRGHGESQGDTNQFGWNGTKDVGAAIQYLQAQPEVQTIGGLGLSLGGEVLLGAASAYPAMKAIISDGATHRSFEELYSLPSERPLYRHFVSRVMYTAVQVFSGDTPPAPIILESIAAARTTHFLLIAAGSNSAEVSYNSLFAETAGNQAALWVVPDVGHIQAYSRFPQEYEQRVISFFQEKLL